MKRLEDEDRQAGMEGGGTPKQDGERKKSPMVSILLAFAAALVIYAIVDAM